MTEEKPVNSQNVVVYRDKDGKHRAYSTVYTEEQARSAVAYCAVRYGSQSNAICVTDKRAMQMCEANG